MDTVVTVDLALLAFVGGTLVPALVALVARRRAHPAVKGGLNFVLALAAGLVAAAQAADGVVSKEGAVAVLFSVVTAQAMHLGLLKPFGITGANGAIAKAVPGGIG